MSGTDDQAIDELAQALTDGGAVALTGAGVSTESGIPDFRSMNGLWERFNPKEYATIEAFRRDPEKVWRMLAELEQTLAGASPNAAHRALAELEDLGLLDGVITQNIDSLHQAGGSRRVVEFHGSGRVLVCLTCGQRFDPEAFGDQMPPVCPNCLEILKPDAILFGEPIPPHAVSQSEELVAEAKVLLVVGTSAEVFPASEIPRAARELGARVWEMNLEPALPSKLVSGRIIGPVGTTLPRVLERVKALRVH